MKDNTLIKEWTKDFQEFVMTSEVEPPQKLTDHILSRIHQDLHPSWILVLSKLAFIHAIIGTLTLLICAYSELHFIHSFNPMNVLMNFGEQTGTLSLLGPGLYSGWISYFGDWMGFSKPVEIRASGTLSSHRK